MATFHAAGYSVFWRFRGNELNYLGLLVQSFFSSALLS